MKRAISLLLAAVLCLALLSACGGSSTGTGSTGTSGNTASGGSAAGGTTFTIGLDSDIVALDPAFAYDFTTNPVVNQITEGLLTFNEQNELVPMLAKSWEQKDDVTYVYTIRDDVTFSDGTPMTMDDVLFSVNRVRDEATASYLGWMYGSVESIEVTGDWELTVKLSAPSATWQYTFGTTAGHVISKAFYEAHADNFGTAESGLLGTGPFKFESWTSGQEVVLVKNENYWDKSVSVAIDRLVFKIIPEDTTRVAAITSGQIDLIPTTPADMLKVVQDDPNVNVDGVDGFAVTFLAFNTQRAPFDDVNVRKAVISAIDLQSIKDNIIGDTAKMGTVLPSSETLFGSDKGAWNQYLEGAVTYPYDLDAAKQYLADSAYPDGFDCTLLVNDASIRYSMALAIQEYLKAININVTLVKVSSDEHTAYQFGEVFDADGKRDYDMIIAGWEADYPDVAGNIEPLYLGSGAGEGGTNTAAYVNADVDGFLAESSAMTDVDARNTLLFKAMDLINEDVPYMFLEYPYKNVAIRKGFTGFSMNASWIWNLYFKNIHPES